jgi:PST family polysaccharide transporter
MDPEHIGRTVTTIAWLSSVVISASMFFGAPWIAPALGSADAVSSIRVLALCVLIIGLFSPSGALLAREFRQDQLFYANMISFIPSNLLLVVLAFTGDGALAFAWSRVLGVVVAGLYTWFAAGHHYWPGWNRTVARLVLGIGLPLAGANLIGFTLLNADYVLVGRSLGTHELGVYLLAFNVSNWSTSLLVSMVDSVAIPAFTRLLHDRDRMRRALVRANKLLAVIAWPISGVTLVASHALIVTLYGQQWVQAAGVLLLLAPYGALYTQAVLFANAINGGPSYARVVLLIQVVWIGVLIPTMLFGLHRWGLRGVAGAHIFLILVIVLPMYAYAMRRLYGLQARLLLIPLIPVLIATLLSAASYLVVAHWVPSQLLKLAVGTSVAVIVYACAMVPELTELLRFQGVSADGRLGRLLRSGGRPRAALSEAFRHLPMYAGSSRRSGGLSPIRTEEDSP